MSSSSERDDAAAREARSIQYAFTRALVLADKQHTFTALDKLCASLPINQLMRLGEAAERAHQTVIRYIEAHNRHQKENQ